MKILITGGAGFVGSHLARSFKRHSPRNNVFVLDNLKRRGSELNLPLLRKYDIHFVHGDIRNSSDFDSLGNFDLFIEASAEPSVLAGLSGSPNYLLQTNLGGTLNCMEFARFKAKYFIFLSTSRVYSIAPLRKIRLNEIKTRFTISKHQSINGVTPNGISEEFPTHLPRSLYGASKLASEMLIQEYVHSYGLKALINRCGVIAGPGQFGKTDQGVFTLWVAHHYFRKPLTYMGFGGLGKQVRDLLHPDDLFALLNRQLADFDKNSGDVFNVGGTASGSISLCELTAICRQVTSNTVPINRQKHTSIVDIPFYISDCRKVAQGFKWHPVNTVPMIVGDIYQWMRQNELQIKYLFA